MSNVEFYTTYGVMYGGFFLALLWLFFKDKRERWKRDIERKMENMEWKMERLRSDMEWRVGRLEAQLKIEQRRKIG